MSEKKDRESKPKVEEARAERALLIELREAYKASIQHLGETLNAYQRAVTHYNCVNDRELIAGRCLIEELRLGDGANRGLCIELSKELEGDVLEKIEELLWIDGTWGKEYRFQHKTGWNCYRRGWEKPKPWHEDFDGSDFGKSKQVTGV